MKIKSIAEFLPITLLGFYAVLFFFTDTDWYREYYYIVIKIDTYFTFITLLSALIFYPTWEPQAKTAILTIILLNILTEVQFRTVIDNYYVLYKNIIILFFAYMILIESQRISVK